MQGQGQGQEYEHEQESGAGAARRPEEGREPDLPDAMLLRAAADGRPDVMGPGGLVRLQQTVGNSGATAAVQRSAAHPAHPVHEVVGSGGGRALDPEVRTDMESRLGHDFGDVRVHTDAAAHESAAAVDAHAYTVGSDVVFQRGAYDPESARGRQTLAHELTHVVQQRSGPVDGTDTGDGVRVSDPGDRFEREAVATAAEAMAAPAPAVQRAQEEDPEAAEEEPA
ncbi:DUF4157 domain-containing protein [Streptomyces sp. NPDC059443]|uniref:eCIS core domain-containing protein n=1 Tax=unclassified Streptomyces TaxID=2593676 RepID=UPI0036BC3EE5